MAIFLPRRWNRQPQYAVTLAAPYQSAIIAGVPGIFDATGRLPTRIGNLISDVQANGRGLRFDSANADTPARRLEWNDAPWNRLTGAHTLIASFTVRTPPTRANKGVLSKWLGTGNQRAWDLVVDYQTNATDTYIRSIVSADGTSTAAQVTQTPVGPAIANGDYVAVSVFRPSTFLGLWVNGVAHASTTSSVKASVFSASAPVWVGTQFSITNINLNSEYCLAGSVQMYAVLPFAVSDAQALDLSCNPWQLFRPAANQTFYSLPSPSQTAGTPQLGLWGDLPWAGDAVVGVAAQTLTPNRYDNTQAFYSPTVTAGAVTLTPDRYDNAQSFYSPTVTTTVDLLPGRYDNISTFYTPTVTAGAVTLLPGRYDNASTFYSPTVTVGTVTLTPARYDNAQTFYSPTVSVAGGLFPDRYDNQQTFYNPTVTRGAVTLIPSLFTQTSSYFTPLVTASYTLTPSLYTNTSSFYTPVVTQGGAVLQPARYDNANTFYSPTVGVTDFDTEVRLTNNAEASLASGVSTLDTVIVVQNTEGTVFPDLGTVGYFYATLTDAIGNYEIVKVSTRINDTMTVVRGQEGTLPIPFAAGSRFQILTTVGNSLAQFNDLDYLLF